MTERTFRTPSPHGTEANGQKQYPPVPQIPQNYNSVPPLPVKSQRRTASMEPAPPRMFSPPPKGPAGRGVSLDRENNVQQSRTAKPRVTSLQNINELERTDSNSSQNFSYPGRARPMSPVAGSRVISQQSTGSPAPGASGAALAAAAGAQYNVTRASEQPVKMKKKKVVRGAAEGSHLQQGGMGGQPIVTPLAPGPAPPAANGESQYAPEKKKKKKVTIAPTGQGTHLPPAARPMSPSYSSDSDSTPEKAQRRVQRASGQLNKQPSVVREDWEGEQDGGPSLGSPARLREEQGLSPVSTPPNIPGKKASTAANVSKKIDEAATKAENHPVHNAVTMPQAANKQHLAVAENGAPATRTTSLSPSRSMRFSDRLSTDLTAGRRHEPLPRSVSPAKSALKQHSPSPTDPRFPGRYIHSQTASEASDNASNISADGIGPLKKKKSARVSFDAEPEIVGTAAAVEQTGTPILASPQDKTTGKKGWFGLIKSKATPALGTIAAEDELEEVMKPRPALPAFGSVRRGGRDTSDPSSSIYAAPMTGARAPTSSAMSSASSEASSASQIPTLDTSISSDHAIGSLLAQDAAKRQTSDQQEPLPPEVTSKEGSGYLSDTESELSQDGRQTQVSNPTDSHKEAVVLPRSTAVPSAPVAGKPLEKVPTVTLQPPTPALELSQQDEWLVTVPGGFPASTDALTNLPTPETETSEQLGSTSPAGLGIAEPTSADTISAASPTERPLDSLRSQSLQKDEDNESSAGDSIYSDAAEEASEHGDGFGSINAIVETPVVETPVSRVMTPPESPLARVTNQARPDGGARTASWDQAQNHWSGIAQAYRDGVHPQPAQQERIAEMPDQPRVQSYADKTPSMKKKKKKVATQPQQSLIPESPQSRTLQQSSSYPRVAPTDIPAPPPFRHSMRAQQEPEQPHFRSSMRQRPQSADQPFARPASPPMQQAAPPRKPRGALQKRNIPPAVAVPAAVTMAARAAALERSQPQPAPQAQNKKLERTMSNDSESDSSFKKRHRRGASSQGSMMRRSMRAPPEPQPLVPAGRGGIRSMSPPLVRRPMSPPLGNKTMRTSMRQSAEPQPPTMRSQPQQQRASSLFGRRKTKSPPPAARAAPLPLTKRITSRFADSDDEDDVGPRTFRSRFEDSSEDEEEPVKYRPVRGIPRKADDGDSTDLDDSDDEKKIAPKPQTLAVITTQANGVGRNADLPSSPTSSTAKKGGFFGRFRSKKEKDPDSRSRLGGTIAERNARLEHNQSAVQAARQEENISTPRKKEVSEKKQASRLGFSSIEERDRVLEQTRLKLEEARNQPGDMLRPSLSTSGRQRPERIMSDSWPLPLKMPAIDEGRPNTSDGVALPFAEPRPVVGGRQPTTDPVHSAGGTPVYGRSGKKKRFPLLRKAFGLDD